MQIEIKIDPSCTEPKLIVLTDSMTDEITSLVKRLSDNTPQILTGTLDETVVLLDQDDILLIYAQSGKVYAKANGKSYLLKLRLYELEDRLDKNSFVRISNSEIINLKKVKGFDLSLSGTICVTLSDSSTTYVSRRYVSHLKTVLGI
ncbi:MAG: LytTR family transcriptional regulator [Clostridia bacterium]|nr:LytTR family transcriptional regulator [Clostridia bacterium]